MLTFNNKLKLKFFFKYCNINKHLVNNTSLHYFIFKKNEQILIQISVY